MVPEELPARVDLVAEPSGRDLPSGSYLVAEPEILPLGKDDDQDDVSEILELLRKPSGSQEKFRKRWIEFDCQKGVHHGKYAEYRNKKRTRLPGGFIGRFDKVCTTGSLGERRVQEFVSRHKCKYPERFQKDLKECGLG